MTTSAETATPRGVAVLLSCAITPLLPPCLHNLTSNNRGRIGTVAMSLGIDVGTRKGVRTDVGSNSHHSRAIARLGQAQDCSLQARLRPAFGGHPGLDDGVLPE